MNPESSRVVAKSGSGREPKWHMMLFTSADTDGMRATMTRVVCFVRQQNVQLLRWNLCWLFVEMAPDGLGGFAGDDGGERVSGGLLHVAQTAEVSEETLAGLLADTWDVEQF